MSQKEKISFTFTEDNAIKAQNIINQYPKNNPASAVMPLLYLAQEQNNGWISEEAMQHIADLLGMHYPKVKQLVNFYTMYFDKKIGKYHIKICRTTPCCLYGSNDLLNAALTKCNSAVNQNTEDGMFTISEVECLGACTEAPVVQINNDYHTKLTVDNLTQIITNLQNNTEITEQ